MTSKKVKKIRQYNNISIDKIGLFPDFAVDNDRMEEIRKQFAESGKLSPIKLYFD